MKKSLFLSVLAIFTMSVSATIGYSGNESELARFSKPSVGVKYAYDTATSITLSDLVQEVITTKNEPVVLKDISISILHGDIEGTISKYTSCAGTLLSETADTFDNNETASVDTWRFLANPNDQVIFKITASANTKAKVDLGSIAGGWLDGTGQYFAAYYATSAGMSKLWEKEITSTSAIPDDYTASADLAVGDSLYYVYGSKVGLGRSIQAIPTFSSDSTSYNAEERLINSKKTYLSATSLSWNENLFPQIVAQNGDPVQMKDMSVGVYQGDVNSTFNKFESVGADLLSKAGTFDGTDGASVQTWRLKTVLNAQVIFEIKATADIKFSLTHTAIDGGWIDDAGQYFELDFKTDDSLSTIWRKDLNTISSKAANAYAGEVMLKAGDSAYFVYGSTEGEERNVNIIPTFTSDTTAYDASIRDGQINQTSVNTYMYDALTACINNGYNDVDYKLYKYGFYYGTIDDIHKFDRHDGDGTGGANDSLKQNDSGDDMVIFQRWQIRCSSTNDAIMKITPSKNEKITITNPAISATWAGGTEIRYYAVDQEGTEILLKDKFVADEGKVADYYGIEVQLRSSDTLYIDYHSISGSYGVVDFAPNVAADTEAYDVTALPDYTAAKALNDARIVGIKKINDAFSTYTESDYSGENWAILTSAKDDGIASIQKETDVTLIDELSQNALDAMSEVKTIAQVTQEITDNRNEKLQEVETFYSGLKESDYKAEDWETIITLYNKVKTDLTAETSKSKMTVLVTTFKTSVNGIVKIPAQTNNTNTGLIVGLSAAGVVVIGTGVWLFFFLKKRKQNNLK